MWGAKTTVPVCGVGVYGVCVCVCVMKWGVCEGRVCVVRCEVWGTWWIVGGVVVVCVCVCVYVVGCMGCVMGCVCMAAFEGCVVGCVEGYVVVCVGYVRGGVCVVGRLCVRWM